MMVPEFGFKDSLGFRALKQLNVYYHSFCTGFHEFFLGESDGPLQTSFGQYKGAFRKPFQKQIVVNCFHMKTIN